MDARLDPRYADAPPAVIAEVNDYWAFQDQLEELLTFNKRAICRLLEKYPSGVHEVVGGLYWLLELFEPKSQGSGLKIKKIPPKARKAVMERDKYRCQNCKGFKSLGIDHVKPRKSGGTNDVGNLRVVCQSCNSTKGAKHSLTSF